MDGSLSSDASFGYCCASALYEFDLSASEVLGDDGSAITKAIASEFVIMMVIMVMVVIVVMVMVSGSVL